MTNFAKTAARLGFTATLLLLAGTIAAEAADNNPNGSGGKAGCEQQAANDYNANVNSCNNVLSDLPGQLAQCISDATDDYRRDKAACSTQARADVNNTVLGGTNGTVQGGNGGGKGGKFNGLKASGAKLSVFN
jgi:hypothetical protein